MSIFKSPLFWLLLSIIIVGISIYIVSIGNLTDPCPHGKYAHECKGETQCGEKCSEHLDWDCDIHKCVASNPVPNGTYVIQTQDKKYLWFENGKLEKVYYPNRWEYNNKKLKAYLPNGDLYFLTDDLTMVEDESQAGEFMVTKDNIFSVKNMQCLRPDRMGWGICEESQFVILELGKGGFVGSGEGLSFTCVKGTSQNPDSVDDKKICMDLYCQKDGNDCCINGFTYFAGKCWQNNPEVPARDSCGIHKCKTVAAGKNCAPTWGKSTYKGSCFHSTCETVCCSQAEKSIPSDAKIPYCGCNRNNNNWLQYVDGSGITGDCWTKNQQQHYCVYDLHGDDCGKNFYN